MLSCGFGGLFSTTKSHFLSIARAASATRWLCLGFRIWPALVLGTCLAASIASAGPPFRTNDPGPVDYQHYEFYTFSAGTHVSGDTSGFGPAFELNYGLIPDGQLHIVAPLAFDASAGQPNQFGYGDTELGFKYRFIKDSTGQRIRAEQTEWRMGISSVPGRRQGR